jgi:hypothetical protein
MRLLIGIDDTDNKESRGTGYNSRQLATAIEQEKLGKVHGITRHQLFVHPDIPYTSQNSSACLDMTAEGIAKDLIHFCRNYMLQAGAEGSDVGLCIAESDRISTDIIRWGEDAKSVVLKMDDALKLARGNHIYLEGLTGTHVGIIGALAAIGLRSGGNDGRFIWLNSEKNLRDIEQGIHTVQDLMKFSGIDVVQSTENEDINLKHRVNLNEWARPLLQQNKAVLLVEKTINNTHYEWKCATKELVKRISN